MTQYGVWVTNKPVPFQRHRYALQQTQLQEGVVDAADYKVVQRALGANMSIDAAIGKAFVQIDSGARNGLAFAYSDAIENLVIAASDATNPRIDQVILQYNDTTIPAGVGGDIPTLRVIGGTPTSGATLDNRNGAAGLPLDAVRLADILVPAASTSVVTANIRDRRPWARGAYRRIHRTQNAAAGSDYTTSSSSIVDIDATNVKPRLECSGAPLRVSARAMIAHSSTGTPFSLTPTLDSVPIDGAANDHWSFEASQTAARSLYRTLAHDALPAAGSHLLGLAWFIQGGGGTLTALARGQYPLQFIVEEIIGANADNS